MEGKRVVKGTLIDKLLDLLFPPKCPFCRNLLEQEEREFGVCEKCREHNRTYAECKKEVSGCEECLAPLWYQGLVKDSVHRYKFSGKSVYAKAYAHLMTECLTEYLEGEWDVITWVPLSKKRLRERGYDQARLLAEAIAAELGTGTLSLLRKDIHTGAQSLLKDASARRANVVGAYSVPDAGLVQGKRVLLVDDVVTTGATLSECAVTLLSAGAAEVRAVTLARGKR